MKTKIIRFLYKKIAKPIFFLQDAEFIHNVVTKKGSALGRSSLTKKLTAAIFKFDDPSLNQKIHNVEFSNPVGLSAGFDYDGHMSEILPHVGFGFSTVGTVTAKPYGGNTPPRLKRLPKSQSLLVNKGFKSNGTDKVIKRLRSKNLTDSTIGISIGSSNLPEINTIEKAIEDYVESFTKFKDESYIKYFELNISCPNTALTEGFSKKENLSMLLEEINKIRIKKPIFIKMANELSLNSTDILVRTSLDYRMDGFIFSNLVKDRTNPVFDASEISAVKSLAGNFSGKPTYENSNKLIHHMYREYGKDTLIIGCGGIFSASDAYEKIKHGASLVQLITGMIYEGPQLIGEINEGLVELLKADGFTNVSDAVGAYHK